MSNEFAKMQQLFQSAVEHHRPEDWDAYLDGACANDTGLRDQVRALLQAHLDADQVPNAVVNPIEPTHLYQHPTAKTGTLVGPYKLIELIGDGGMGTVWMAQQTSPVTRLVALKLIKHGMASKQFIARFEAERQALALMDHPNICRVLDAGTTCNEQPYFVMELVKGVALTKYCDDHRLTLRQRLELFIPVCHAIQHAHQKGIIHRDLKPSNVLVAQYDGTPVPKIIDFGVAKAAGPSLTDKTLVTGFGAIVGTLEYMSPEQAELNQIDIDTRSDIYSLGVLLYELLTGAPPFSRKELAEAGMLEMLRLIREKEPTRPSTKLSTVEGLPTLAATRGTAPDKLAGLMRGELDWIVMKCLEKDRQRRYVSAGDLALDLHRHLVDEPVLACPPALNYLIRKFVRRNKRVVGIATALAIVLTGGVVGTAVGFVRAEKARQAETARADGERSAKEAAEKRLVQVEKGVDAFGSLFENLDPFAEEKYGQSLRALLSERLDRLAADLDGDSIGDPLMVAKLQDRLGQTYLALGQAAKAEVLFAKAHATRVAELGAADPATLATASRWAGALFEIGKRTEAIALFEQVQTKQLATLGEKHLDTLVTQHHLGVAYRFAGRVDDARRLLEQVRDERERQLGLDHELTLATMQKLAGVNMAAGKRAEAVKLSKQVLDIQTKKYRSGHPHIIAAMNDLAYAYQYAYRMQDALDLLGQTRTLSEAKLGPHHPLTLSVLHNIARLERAFGRTPKAIEMLEEVRTRRVAALGQQHPATLSTVYELALAHEDAGDTAKAIVFYEQAARGVEQQQFIHGDADTIIDFFCQCLEKAKRLADAEYWRRQWLTAMEKKFGPRSPVVITAQIAVGANLIRQKKYAAAEPLLEGAFATLQNNHPETWAMFQAQSLLGAVYHGQHKYEVAEPLLTEGYQGMKKTLLKPGKKRTGTANDVFLRETVERVIECYDALKMKDKADEWRRELEPAK